jgi:uncharacterized protein YecE (DUF72 family)
MKFGKLDDLEGVDFTLPPTSEATSRVLSKGKGNCEVLLGCPAWGCKDWVGKLYPTGTKPTDYLKFYAQQFHTIELNTTYYRTPDATTIARWDAQTNPDFRFAPKISQQISHSRRLGQVKQLTEVFCESFVPLAEKLGSFFLQLPPNFSPNETHKLINFIREFPLGFQLAVEFRHDAWFGEGSAFEEVCQALEERNFLTVLTDVAGRRDVLHLRLTTPELMIRFVGNSLHPSDYQRADQWVQRLSEWAEMGLEKVYFFIHEPDEIDCPEMAIYFASQLAKKTNLRPKLPKLITKFQQGSLF